MIRVERLELTAMPGIPHDQGFVLQDLSPGINIIHGPNGCGKTSAATAMRDLIWHHAPTRALPAWTTLTVSENDAVRWRLERRDTRVEATRDGAPADPPQWSPADTRARHTWTLRDLMDDGAGDLARRVGILMQGNVDLDLHAKALGWDTPPRAPQKLANELLQAEKAAREIRNQQQALLQDAEKLREREAECRVLQDTAATAPLIEKALRIHQLEARLGEVRSRLERAPPGMDQLRRDDLEILEKKQADLEVARARLRDVGTELDALPAPDPAFSEHPSPQIRLWLEEMPREFRELDRLRQQADAAQSQVDAIAAKIEVLRKRQGDMPLPEPKHAYAHPELREYLHLRQQAESERALAEAWAEKLDAPPDVRIDPDDLRLAIEEVRRYLRHPGGTDAHHPLTLALLFLLTGYAAWLRVEDWWAALPLLPLILALSAWQSHRRRRAQLRERLPDSLEAPENDTPDAWREQLQAWTLLRERLTLRARIERQHRIAEEAEARARDAIPNLDGIDPKPDPFWIVHYLQDLQTLRDLELEQAAALKTFETTRETVAKKEEIIRGHLHPHLENPDPEPPEIGWNRLERKLNAERGLREKREALKAEHRRQNQRREELSREIQDTRTRLKLESSDLAELERRLGQLEEWRRDFRDSESLGQQLSELRKSLETTPEWLDLDEPALQAKADEAEQARLETERLREQITRLDQDVRHARKSQNLHLALETVDQKRAELEAARQEALDIRTGIALIDWLRSETRNQARPPVFKAANRYLALFTQGTLALDFDGDQFRAATLGGDSRPLEQLSTGERAQVLMAVRLAFLDGIDTVKLPLFVDEALGTSDDDRARQIMDALIATAQAGRQIFYFTAQLDEVGKWRQALAAADVPHAEIDLEVVRKRATARKRPLPASSPEKPATPRPEPDEAPEAWARRIGIPAPDPRAPVEQAHLWHVARDPALTAELMDQGLQSWGALKALLDAGGWPDRIPEARENEIRTRALRLEVRNKAWCIGRPRPLTERDLRDSGAVSDAFIDKVEELRQSVEGDARQLIESLQNGEVSGWRKNKTEELRAYFEERGLITPEEPLDEEMIQARVLAATPTESRNA